MLRNKNLLNVIAGVFVLVASGVATWLFIPAASAPYRPSALPQTPLVVSIGPFQVNLMLIVLIVAGGAPFAAIVMALLVRWLGRIAAEGAAAASAGTAPAPAKRPAAASAPEAAKEKELPLAQQLVWWVVILVAVGAMVVLIWQVLPPGFTLF